MPKIEIYSTQVCPYCDKAKALLKKKGLEFIEYKVDDEDHPELREQMLKRSDGRRSVPQIFINDIHIGGCDDLYAKDKAGEIDPLLNMIGENDVRTEESP